MAEFIENSKSEKDAGIFSLSYLVLTVLILLTLGVTYNFYKSAKIKDLIRFNNQVSRFNFSIENNINLYKALLKGSKGFVETTPNLNRKNFADYINNLDLRNKYSGVEGNGFTKIIKPEERAATIKAMRAQEGYEDFKIFPEDERKSYQAILFLEPQNESSRRVIGYDMSTNPIRLQAMEIARDTGSASVTAKETLIGENGEADQNGFLIYLPIYAAASGGEKVLTGYVYSPFRGSEFLNEIHKNIPDKDIGIKIYDAKAEPENLIAQTADDYRETDNLSNITDEHYAALSEVEIAGRKWIVEYNSLPAFAEQSSVSWTPLILLCGFAFSFMLFGMTYWEAAARAKVQKTAAELFEVQKQKQTLLENEQKARQTAEQANASKDEFIAIVSHELKTPLNTVAGWARILKTGNISPGTKEMALQKIDKNLRAQAALVEQLLSYSEIISGKCDLDKEKIDFAELYGEVLGEIKPLADEKKIEIVSQTAAANPPIAGDREKLKIVVHNLLANAIKFSPTGGKIESEISHSNGDLQMTVKDYGRGIGADFLPQIFERYKQADDPSVRDYGGLGLGLTISKHIVNLHRGKIYAQSAGKGKGSTFTIVLPVDKSV